MVFPCFHALLPIGESIPVPVITHKGLIKNQKSIKLISLIEKKKNITNYSLSLKQVEAILELRLQKLTAYGISEIEDEINKLAILIVKYNIIRINNKFQ